MLAFDVIVNLAHIMLIFNGCTVLLNKADATAANASTFGVLADLQQELISMSKESSQTEGIPASVKDVFSIRHERSKQRRHAITAAEQQPAEHLSRNVYEARPDPKGFQLQNDIKDGPLTASDMAYDDVHHLPLLTERELDNFSQDIHSHKNHEMNAVFRSATHIHALNNVTSSLSNRNDKEFSSNKENIVTGTAASMYEPVHAPSLHVMQPAAAEPTATPRAMTHRIRKLHKKKLVESLRQLNIDKFNTNGGHLTKNHHRSLLEAEHRLQEQQQQEINKTAHTPGGSYQQTTSPDANSSHQMAKESNGNKALTDIDTNESLNVGDLTHIMEGRDEQDKAVDDRANDKQDETNQDHDDSLSDVFYPNDDNNSNLNNDEDFNGRDDVLLFDSTMISLLNDDKFEKPFKNFSSEFIKDVDNSVDLEVTENETFFTSWQDIKDLHLKILNVTNLTKNLTQDIFAEQTNNHSSPTDTPNELLLSSVDPMLQPLNSVSSSQISTNFQPLRSSPFFRKEEITFNDSSDLKQNDNSAAQKDVIMDEDLKNERGGGNPADDDDDTSAQFSDFSLSNLDDSAEGSETEVTSEVAGDDDTNHFLEGVVDAANSEEIYDWDEISRSNRRDLMHGRDVVTKFLQIVETQHSLGSNCEAGTSLNLGEGVVDRYAQDRFRVEAEVAVNRANMLTRIFKMTSAVAQADVNLLHASVLSMVEFDDDIFAAGNCFDWNEHPAQPGLFCPFAYRLPPPNLGAILAKDLAMEYHYLGNTSEWFFQARKNAEKVIARNEQYLKAFHLYSNKTDERIEDDTLAVKYEDGRWSKPYYDCGGGNIWMLTYTVPFFGYENFTYHFKGTSGIDIDLRRVDIDQCPQRNIPGSTKPLNIFAGTDKCKQRTTMCEAIQGLGFRRGSYKCVCRKGYYFPDTTSQHKYFNGSLLEEEYEKLMLGKNSTYNIVNEYECLPCAEGCDSCEDGSPCIAALNWPMRTSILVLACVVIGLLPPATWFTFRYQQVKVVRAASPALLRVIALGAFFIYCTNIVMYPNPNLYTCTSRIWLREIGFSLTYGALMLKTWRISVIFRVRSAKAVKITDATLLKRLGCICGVIGTCLLVRTLVSPPDVVVGRTADDLKAFLCKTDWWDYTFTSMEVVFLAWGVRLCIMVRKAPSEFNESRFISMAIYNEFLLTCFLNVSMLFLQSPANPDLLYIIFFCHTQLTITLLLALIFGSRVYIVLRSGKSHQESIGMDAKSSERKFNFQRQVRTFANQQSTTSTTPAVATTSAETKLTDQEALEEIRQLSMQLQRIQEMAPPKGVAVMTISSLLDGFKTPTSMVTTAKGQVTGMSGKQLTVRIEKPEALPLLSLSEEMKKYQQLQVPQKAITTATTLMLTTTTNNNVAVMKSIPAIALPSSQPSVTTTTTTTDANNKVLTAIGPWEEKAVNTEIIGSCVAEENFKHLQLHEHIVCQSCYEKCKNRRDQQTSSAQLDKCQMLGSPQPEGSISFQNIKLDCMCSQSDDLDQLTEAEEHHQTIRRPTTRTAATNTPPSTARKRAGLSASLQPAKESKVLSSVSLPGHSRNLPQDISFRSSQQSQRTQQQICDNCKNKLKRKDSIGKTKAAGKRLQQQQQTQQQQHRKLSRLSSKCTKLIRDIEISERTKATTSFYTTTTTQQPQQPQQQQKPYDCDEDPQYSTDDIIFYTTTDSSDNDEDDDVDDDEDNDDETDDEQDDINKNDDLSLILAHSKSDTRVPFKLKPHQATVEFKCISLSLGNITTNSSLATATSSTSSSTQPDFLKSKTALVGANNTTIQVTATTGDPAAASPATQPTLLQQQNATAPSTSTNPANGGNNGKAKRPDKLVLNLNDRSKFTKEVSV